jgi:diguanylate cyclase (GGDEF)-like protein
MKPTRLITSVFYLGVRQKVVLVLVMSLIIALSISSWLAFEEQRSNTLHEIDQRGNDISRFVSKSLTYSVVGYDYHTIQLLLDEIVLSEDVGYARVMSRKGNVMAESGVSPSVETSDLVLFNQPITLDSDTVGELVLGLSTARTVSKLEQQKYGLIKREALVILLIVIGEFLALSFIIVRPVCQITNSLDGNMSSDGSMKGKVPVKTNDEFGLLAISFNRLFGQLNDANTRLQSKVELADRKLLETNEQLRQQSRELQDMNEKFRLLSITDELTGLYNRRHFEEAMHESMAIARRHHDANSVIIIDLDHFKQVNDKYGHPVGDQMLKEVASVMQSILRDIDVFCRIGGEEFAVVSKRADKSAAMQIAEKLRSTIEDEEFCIDEQIIPMTVSIGVSTLTRDAESNDDFILYRQADDAVYASKAAGRNYVTHYDDIHQQT